MANTTIRLKKSSVSAHLPTAGQLEHGEIALNYADGKIFYKDPANNIQQISGSANTFYTVNANGTLLVSTSPTDILTINPGNNIEVTGDFLTDTLTIGANLKSVYDVANAAFDSANNVAPQIAPSRNTANAAYVTANAAYVTANAAYSFSNNISNTLNTAFSVANAAYVMANLAASAATINIGAAPPSGVNPGALWWDTISGRMFIYYTDADSSQWVETSPSGGQGGGSSTDTFQNGASFIVIGDSAILSRNVTTTSTDDQIVDTFAASVWHSATYKVTINSGSSYHTTQISVLNDGSDAVMTEYGILYTGGSLATFNVSVVSSSVRLNVIPTNASSTIRLLRTTTK